MSLDSTQVATIGAVATPIATIINPALGLAVAAGTSLATASLAADEQRELTASNIRRQMDAQSANEERQRRDNARVVGRFRSRIASSGFTTRGSPIELLASVVADQELDIQTDRFHARMSAEDLRIRGEFSARQTEARGISEFSRGLGRSGASLLGRDEAFDLLGEA
jgi:hypothetical protein